MASAIRAPGHRSSPSILIVAALVALIPACSGKHSAGTKAIHLSDKSISLLPGRLLAAPSSGVAYENSIRMMMFPIGCKTGPEIRRLEELSASDPEVIRRIGRAVVGQDGKPIQGAESCKVLGNFAVHPWSYSRLFEAPPRSRAEFANQQWVWLAFRGRTTDSNKTFSRGFDRWMAEGGIYRSVPVPLMQAKIAAFDVVYNPCVAKTDSRVRFNKNDNFRCVDGDYAPAYDKLGNTLSWMIEQSAVELLSAISAKQFPDFNTEGIESAIILDPKGLEAALSAKFNLAGSESEKTAKVATGKAGGLLSGLVGLIIGRNRNQYSYGSSMQSAGSYRGMTPINRAGYGGFGQRRRPAPVQGSPLPASSPRRIGGQPVAVPEGSSLIQYPGEDHAYYTTNVTTDWQRKMESLYGSDYVGTQKLVGTNGEVLYVDRFKDGKNDWYKEVDGKMIATHSTVGTVGVIDRSDLVKKSEVINGRTFQVVDNTEFNRKLFTGQESVESTFYRDPNDPRKSFYLDRQSNGATRAYDADGSKLDINDPRIPASISTPNAPGKSKCCAFNIPAAASQTADPEDWAVRYYTEPDVPQDQRPDPDKYISPDGSPTTLSIYNGFSGGFGIPNIGSGNTATGDGSDNGFSGGFGIPNIGSGNTSTGDADWDQEPQGEWKN